MFHWKFIHKQNTQQQDHLNRDFQIKSNGFWLKIQQSCFLSLANPKFGLYDIKM